MRSLQEVSHILATEGNICPGCGIKEIKLKDLRALKVEPGTHFNCVICGTKLRYSTVKQPIGEILFLHLVGGPYDASK
jgi:hypothetical protein